MTNNTTTHHTEKENAMAEVATTETVTFVRVDVRAAVKAATDCYRRHIREAQRNVRANVRAVKRLVAAGLVRPDEVPQYGWSCVFFNVLPPQLPRWRDALGVPLRLDWKDVEDAAEQTVRVTLSATDEKGLNLRLRYVKRLPPNSKCRIVAETVTRHNLVCER